MAFTPLNALNAFVAVARRLSYAAAAKDLGVSTSALSQSVRQLEERLEVTLLTRTSRSVALTDAGQRLLDHAGAAVDQALESLKTVRAKRGEVTGRVRLTVPLQRNTRVAAILGGDAAQRNAQRNAKGPEQPLRPSREVHDCVTDSVELNGIEPSAS